MYSTIDYFRPGRDKQIICWSPPGQKYPICSIFQWAATFILFQAGAFHKLVSFGMAISTN